MISTPLVSPLDGALYMHQKGFKVFPLAPNSKVPPKNLPWEQWAEHATEDTIRAYANSQPYSNWGVHCGGSGHTGVDLDNKINRNGIEPFRAICAEHQSVVPSTLTVKTPTGGFHLYFTGIVPNTNDAIAPGIETRSKGQYLVAPGSLIDNVPYTVITNGIPAHMPPWLIRLVNAKKQTKVIAEGEYLLEGERNVTLAAMAGSLRRHGANEASILASITAINDIQIEDPLPQHDLEILAHSIAQYKPEDAKVASDFYTPVNLQAITADTINVHSIPKRKWVMMDRFIGGFISVIISPGGIGKSTLSMLDAVAVATGQPLTGFKVVRPGAVWIYNTEDPTDELKRRIAALSQHHNIPLSTLSNIHLTSGRDNPLVIAKQGHDGVLINQDAIDNMTQYIKENDIKLLMMDPFVGVHEVNENDNMQINKVVDCFRRITDRTGCAICLVHHARKGGGLRGDADKSRGASALINACRVAHDISVMDDNEADKFGIPPNKRYWYIRLDNAKANLQPPAEKAHWFARINVHLPNDDDVGTVEKFNPVDHKQKKAIAAVEPEKDDFLRALYDGMTPGTIWSLTDLYAYLKTSEKHAHVFKTVDSEKRMRERITTLMQMGLSDGLRTYEYHAEKGKGRAKIDHYIRCVPTAAVSLPEFLR